MLWRERKCSRLLHEVKKTCLLKREINPLCAWVMVANKRHQRFEFVAVPTPYPFSRSIDWLWWFAERCVLCWLRHWQNKVGCLYPPPNKKPVAHSANSFPNKYICDDSDRSGNVRMQLAVDSSACYGNTALLLIYNARLIFSLWWHFLVAIPYRNWV